MAHNNLISHLINIENIDTVQSRLPEINERIKATILRVGSETEDNLACIRLTEYGQITRSWEGWSEVFGLKIHNKNILISEILNAAEGIELPEQVRELIPNLSSEEWDAALRLVTLVLIALEEPKQ